MNTKEKTITILLSAVAAALWAVSRAGGQTEDLREFAKNAAIGGMAEVELGKVAARKASSPRVKAFGQHMVDDHSKANVVLKAAAGRQGIDVPASLDAEHQHDVQKLSSLSGAAFDRAYMDDMVEDHEKDVAEFEKASKQTGESPIKKFAQDTLPTLREHLKMAQDVQKEVKAAGSGSHP